MSLIDTTRRAAVLLFGAGIFAAGCLAAAQSSALPATLPTAAKPGSVSPATPSSAPSAAPAAAPIAAKPAGPAEHRAEVVYSGGQISIAADDSSLNQILGDIARQTGMKITGGVVDQRVFGKYGPGAPAQILASLLEGTGSNMFLRESPTHAPEELILTPRNGGPSPPSPNASGIDDAAHRSEQSDRQRATGGQQAQVSREPSTARTQPTRGSVGAPGVSPSTAPETARPSTTDSNPQSPNGVATPQQILQQMQSRPQPNAR